MADSNADVFLELKQSNDEKLEGDCIDIKFAGMIEIEDFEVSARSMADRQKAEAMESMLEASTEGGKTDTVRGDVDLRHLENKGAKGVFTLKLTKVTDSTSPSLALSYSKNLRSEKDSFKEGKLFVRKRGGSGSGVVYLTYMFKNLYVVNYNLNLSGGKGDSGTSIPEEDVEFVFESLAMKYVQQAKTGGGEPSRIASWSFKGKDTDSALESELKKP
jgi:type VI protein secretion system component Hcp